ncbi:MAG TPA: sugar phosphate isomerase/epimerase [Solirubrobacteraceae bacterium]|nr:sugar phosphate isomerase/epimerase [Solirubrobacteraceae bacterium]
MAATAPDACLWGATLAFGSPADRVQAAVAGGFATTTMFPHDYRRARETGLCDDDILALHRDADVRLRTLDPFARWVPRWEPPADADPDRLALVSCGEEEFFDIAQRLRIETMTAIEPFGARHAPADLASAFGDLCDRAAGQGMLVHLEFTPFSGIPDLAAAWDVVRAADRANGGLVFDTWHYFRGRRDDALLREIPGDRIFAVQINDAAASPRDPLIVDTWRFRRLPGDGDFDLAAVLEILAAKPGIGPPGIEVLSEELWLQPPAEIGRRGGAALAAALAPLTPWGGS